ncbi:MAG: hypothetical protein JO272_12720 [Pseudonocardiales bacterium]|nr:hypothetical protein [Pseudonocardiales bacterium]
MTITPTADLVANDWTALSAAAVPFLAAIALFLISPLLTAKVKVAVLTQIAEEAWHLNVPEDKTPPQLTRESVDAYIEYAMDAVQIVPLTLLPVTGGVFAIAAHVPGPIALGYLSIAILAAVAVEAWVLSQPAGKYVSHRFVRYYSVVTATGIASNLLGLAMILIYGP